MHHCETLGELGPTLPLLNEEWGYKAAGRAGPALSHRLSYSCFLGQLYFSTYFAKKLRTSTDVLRAFHGCLSPGLFHSRGHPAPQFVLSKLIISQDPNPFEKLMEALDHLPQNISHTHLLKNLHAVLRNSQTTLNPMRGFSITEAWPDATT